MTTEAFPLDWPDGWPREENPTRSRYTTGYSSATEHLLKELRLLKATDIVISSNVPIKRNGLPYANFSSRRIYDAGVAVYFVRYGKQQVIACDAWNLTIHNIHAVGLTVAGLRSIQRAGATELLDRAFTGFKALPAAGEAAAAKWWHVLGVDRGAPVQDVKDSYRRLAATTHPDCGGDAGAMAMINKAWGQAQNDLNGR